MPITLIHEKIAGMISNKNKEYDNPDFYLGNIAPDTVNLNGFAPKEERWTSHIRRKDLNEWKKAVIEFYKKEKDNYPEYFILGYISHILTDIIYDEKYYNKVISKINENNKHEVMLKDMELYIYNSNSKEIINSQLRKIKEYYDILNIKKTNMQIFTTKLQENKEIKEKNKYIDNKLLQNIFIDVYNEIDKLKKTY